MSYRTARGVAVDPGERVTGFDGNHGWSSRNRDRRDVMVQLITTGAFTQIDEHLKAPGNVTIG